MKLFAYALMAVAAVFFLALAAAPMTDAGGKDAGGLTFQVFKDADREFRWRLRAANGRIIADSNEGYTTKAACEAGIALVKEGAAKASVEDQTGNE